MIFRILIVVVDDKLAAHIRGEGDRIIPKEWLTKGYFQERGASLTASAFVISENSQALYNEIVKLRQKADGIILIYQKETSPQVKFYARSCFVRTLEKGGNFSNMLARNISITLREFAAFSKYFDAMKYQQLCLLPFDIFRAHEFNVLCNLLATGDKHFISMLPNIFSEFKRRQQPKRTGRSPKIYYVDDTQLFFIYGPEKHSRVEVAEPPHSSYCALNSDFRYGRRYDPERHFNVSLETDKSVFTRNFTGCHGQAQGPAATTHFNIFPNGFVA
jgi:hypothetical protein